MARTSDFGSSLDDYDVDSENRDAIAELEQAKQELADQVEQLLNAANADEPRDLKNVGQGLIDLAASLSDIEDEIRRMGG